MKFSMGHQWVDVGLEKILKNVNELATLRIRVGVVGSKAKETTAGGLTIGEVALINEYGSRKARIPARSFIRSGLRSATVNRLAKELIESAIRKGRMKPALHTVGERMAQEVRLRAMDIAAKGGNAAATIQSKGFDMPLVETHKMINAISYEIVDAGVGGDIQGPMQNPAFHTVVNTGG